MVKRHMDIPYKQIGDITLFLDIYLPENAVKPPLIMWIHGGAWMFGDRKSPGLLRQLERGYALASIEYRLTGQGIFPCNIIDCKDALVFLKQNAGEYGYDPARIVAAGDSAGGHLAALMGTTTGQADFEPSGADCSVQAVVDFYGPVAVDTGWDSAARPDSYESQMLGTQASCKQGRARAAAASPVTYIDGTEPPFLILHGDKDDTVPYKQSIILRDALEKAGVPVSLHRVFGGGHGFDSTDANAAVDAFLDYYFL